MAYLTCVDDPLGVLLLKIKLGHGAFCQDGDGCRVDPMLRCERGLDRLNEFQGEHGKGNAGELTSS